MRLARFICLGTLIAILAACGGGSSSGDTNTSSPAPPVSPPPPPSANQLPTADAGSDQSVDEGAAVNLTGTGADTDGSITSFSWQQVGGAEVVISSANTANASFIAPMVSSLEVLEFRLLVTDNDDAVGSDTVSITVNDVAPTSTADLDALIDASNSRLTSEIAALESEQATAQSQAAAAGTYLSGGYLSGARSRIINHADSFFSFVSDEAIRLTDNGTQFSRSDIITLLDSYQTQWLSYLDQFFASSLFSGHSSNSLNSIKAEVSTFIEDKINF